VTFFEKGTVGEELGFKSWGVEELKSWGVGSTRCTMHDARNKIRDAGYGIRDMRYTIHKTDAGCTIHDS